MTSPTEPEKPTYTPPLDFGGIAMVGLAVGTVTLVIIFGAVALGLWVDGLLNTAPLFTGLMVLISAPVSFYLTYRVALWGAARMTARNPPAVNKPKQSPSTEEENAT